MTREEAINELNLMEMVVRTPKAAEAVKLASIALRAQQDHFREDTKMVEPLENDVSDKDVWKWISVKDRLPDEKSGRVLMTDGKRHYIAPREWMHRTNGADGIYIPANHGTGAKVTHWMPLPEPPEGE